MKQDVIGGIISDAMGMHCEGSVLFNTIFLTEENVFQKFVPLQWMGYCVWTYHLELLMVRNFLTSYVLSLYTYLMARMNIFFIHS